MASGITQRYRDSRIAPIYEGTNRIQAIDLVSRKTLRDKGIAMGNLVSELVVDVHAIEDHDNLRTNAAVLTDVFAALATATKWLVGIADQTDDWLAGVTAYLDFAAVSIVGGLMAGQVLWAYPHRPADEADAVAGAGRLSMGYLA